jgi:MOSC domain-containing protein YiiM
LTPRQTGKLEAIWVKRVRRGLMDPVTRAELVEARGIVGNANQRGRRQVTIIEREAWETVMALMNASLPPSTRRANLMVSGISLKKTRGSLLTIGDVILEIGGEVKPCERMDEALPGLKQVMYAEWRGGAFATVVRGGTIGVGDEAVLQSANAEMFE